MFFRSYLGLQNASAPYLRRARRIGKMSRRVTLIIVAVVVVAGGAVAWFVLRNPGLPPGFAGANGRLEAKQVDIATKFRAVSRKYSRTKATPLMRDRSSRRWIPSPLEAQLRSDEAKTKEAQDNRRTALAEVAAKQAEFNYSEKQYRRSKELVSRGAVSEQEADVDQAHMEMTEQPCWALKLRQCELNPLSTQRLLMRNASRPKSGTACSRPQSEAGFRIVSLSRAKSFRLAAKYSPWSI